MKKKILALTLAALLALVALTACGGNTTSPSPSVSVSPAASPSAAVSPSPDNAASPEVSPQPEAVTIKIGASPVPHAEILEFAKTLLAAKNITLEIVVLSDYVIPNTSLEDGTLDANFFQHRPYQESFNAEHGTHIVDIGDIHYEPFGIYPGKTASLDALPDKAKVAVPNDTTNEARALQLLESAGLIKLKAGVGLNATKLDIEENPKNLDIIELEAAQIPRTLPDVDIAAINGNYALDAGLNPSTDALFVEPEDSEAATTFANIVSVKEGNENRPELIELVNVLKSAEVKAFITEKYGKAVIPSK